MMQSPPQARITWLASYPKSGGTWTRTFLAHYLREAVDQADLDDQYHSSIASSRLMFDRAIGIDAACLLPWEIDALRPAVYRHVATLAERPLFLKVHDAWKRTQAGEPLFPLQITHAAIYIARNPLDVATTARHHYGQSLEDSVNQLCQSNFTLSKSRQGAASGELSQRVGDWSSHVHSWLHESDLPVHLMRYEDLLADPFEEFARMLEALDIEVDEARLNAAVEASDSSRPREPEEFISGDWRTELEPKFVQRIIDAHGTMMRELRYLDDRQRPFY